jgi:hypothetical protein
LIVLLAIVTLHAGRTRWMFDAWLGAIVIVAALAGLWSVTRVRDQLLDHEVFWLVALGPVAAAVVLVAAAERVVSRAPAIERAAARGAVLLTAVALILAVLDFGEFVEFEHREPGQRDVPPAVAAIEARLDLQHARAAVIDVDTAWAQAVPIVLRLRQHHRRVSVSPGALFIFTDAFAPTGKEDAEVRVQFGSLGAPDGNWQQIFDSYWANVYAR